MIKNSENGTDVNSSMLEKKEWVEPQIMQLSIKETKTGGFSSGTETWTNWFGS